MLAGSDTRVSKAPDGDGNGPQIAGTPPSFSPLWPNHLAAEEFCTCPGAVPHAVCRLHYPQEWQADVSGCKLPDGLARLEDQRLPPAPSMSGTSFSEPFPV